jgi:hypothetical protein
MHRGDLKPGTLGGILKQAAMTHDDLRALLSTRATTGSTWS